MNNNSNSNNNKSNGNGNRSSNRNSNVFLIVFFSEGAVENDGPRPVARKVEAL